MSTSKVSLVCLKARYIFFSEAIIGLKMFIPGNSCDFVICRMFFVSFFFDIEK